MATLRPFTGAFSPSIGSTLPACSCRTAIVHHNGRGAQRRTFIPNPFAAPQSLNASRTLPYPPELIYSIISDVDSYSTFLPYCQGSVVTKRSQPASDGKRYPEEAKLAIGFHGDVSETFWSRVYCVPGCIVEAVGGVTATTLRPDTIAHHSPRPTNPADDPTRQSTVLSHLLTRWTLRPLDTARQPPAAPQESRGELSASPGPQKTDVSLAIEFQFANPLYAALSSAAAPMVAERMIEAFEERVRKLAKGQAGVSGQ